MQRLRIKRVDLERMHKETGLSISAIRTAFERKSYGTCRASTTEEAQKAYHRARDDSPSKAAAWIKWLELSLADIERALTVGEMRKAYYSSPVGSAIGMLAWARWDKLSLAEVEKATTIEEIRAAIDNAPSLEKARGLGIRKLATFFPKKK